jgi:alkanesulfonate monooxygenase SsuD/methylene tetrahydromethanopterin reductase-like flavin-dependent oxidoreductase (luciferase family)
MVLTEDDVPEIWRQNGGRRYLVGAVTRDLPAATRARRARLPGYMAGFVDRKDPRIGLVSQVAIYVDEDDARSAFEYGRGRYVKRPGLDAFATDRDPLDVREPIGNEQHAEVVKSVRLNDPQRPGEQHTITWRQGRAVCGILLGGYVGLFNASDLVRLARLQDRRVTTELDKSACAAPPTEQVELPAGGA